MTTERQRAKEGGVDVAARRSARLAAVQAVYQMELTGLDAEMVIDEFQAHRFRPDWEVTPAAPPDEAFFSDIVRGVPHRQSDIDQAIARCLTRDWKFGRIDSILRAILRAATYELIARHDVPAKSTIDEYLDITRAFLEGEEVGFVNAVLDQIAHDRREAEIGKAPNRDASQT